MYSSGAAGDSIRPQKRINATQFGKNWLQRDRGRASEIELINPLEGGNLPEDTSSTFKLKLYYGIYTRYIYAVYIQYTHCIRYTPYTLKLHYGGCMALLSLTQFSYLATVSTILSNVLCPGTVGSG